MRRRDYLIIAAVLGLSLLALMYVVESPGWSLGSGWEAEVLGSD